MDRQMLKLLEQFGRNLAGDHGHDHDEDDHGHSHAAASHDDHDDDHSHDTGHSHADAHSHDDDHGHDHGTVDANEETPDDEEDGISLTSLKIIVIFCMLVCVGFGVIPKVWGADAKNESLLAYLNCFSAGLFLGMALIHIMPEAAHLYDEWALQEQKEDPFPLPYVLFYVGYLIILGVDRVAARSYHFDRPSHDHEKVADDSAVHTERELENIPKTPEKEDVGQLEEIKNDNDANAQAPSSNTPITQVQPQTEEAKAAAAAAKAEADAVGVSKTSAFILILAISVHAVFEGVALGLQKTVDQTWQLSVGIILHKIPAAISIGGAFTRAGLSLRTIILLIAFFSLTTPIGIIIGMAVSGSNLILDVIFHSLSGGTFIYVACSEIIVQEFERKGSPSLKMLLVFLGGLLIALLWLIGGHDHGHGGHGDDHGHDHLLRY